MRRKSTRRVFKTARAQQPEAEPKLEEATLAADVEEVRDADQSFNRREEEEESEELPEDETDEDKEDDDIDEDDEVEDEPQIVQVVPQKRKKGKDTENSKPTSKPFKFHSIFSSMFKLSSEHVKRRELDDSEAEVENRKITYNLTIFSLAELAKPQARREPAARFIVLPSNLEWSDIDAQLKIKAGDVLYPGQVAIANNAYEMTFCIARHIPNPLPLSCIADYQHLVENALRQQQPTVKVIIKATAQV